MVAKEVFVWRFCAARSAMRVSCSGGGALAAVRSGTEGWGGGLGRRAGTLFVEGGGRV